MRTLLFLLLALDASAQPAARAFSPGEQCTYEVSYLGVPTGTAVVTVGMKMHQFDHDVWPIVATAQTELAIFPVKDRYVAYWDFAANRTIASEFFVDEGRKRRRERIRYDPVEKKAFATKQKEGGAPVEITYDVPDGTRDLVAIAMQTRNRSALEVGDEFEAPIFTGLKTFVMKAKVSGRETVATRLGDRACLKVGFTVDWSGNLQAKQALSIWFTDDATRLPVRFEADLLLGAVVAEVVTFYPGMERP